MWRSRRGNLQATLDLVIVIRLRHRPGRRKRTCGRYQTAFQDDICSFARRVTAESWDGASTATPEETKLWSKDGASGEPSNDSRDSSTRRIPRLSPLHDLRDPSCQLPQPGEPRRQAYKVVQICRFQGGTLQAPPCLRSEEHRKDS